MKKKLLGSLFAFLAMLSLGHATNYYWTGAVSTDFTDPNNWLVLSGTAYEVPTTCPRSNDYNDIVYFQITDEYEVVNKTVTASAGRNIWQVYFNGGQGWNINFNYLNAKSIYIYGADTVIDNYTRINTQYPIVYCEGTITFGEFYYNYDAKLSGTGTIIANPNSWNAAAYIRLLDSITFCSTLTTPGRKKDVIFDSPNAKLRYQNTVEDAEARFGKTADNSNGIVNGYDTENYYLSASIGSYDSSATGSSAAWDVATIPVDVATVILDGDSVTSTADVTIDTLAQHLSAPNISSLAFGDNSLNAKFFSLPGNDSLRNNTDFSFESGSYVFSEGIGITSVYSRIFLKPGVTITAPNMTLRGSTASIYPPLANSATNNFIEVDGTTLDVSAGTIFFNTARVVTNRPRLRNYKLRIKKT